MLHPRPRPRPGRVLSHSSTRHYSLDRYQHDRTCAEKENRRSRFRARSYSGKIRQPDLLRRAYSLARAQRSRDIYPHSAALPRRSSLSVYSRTRVRASSLYLPAEEIKYLPRVCAAAASGTRAKKDNALGEARGEVEQPHERQRAKVCRRKKCIGILHTRIHIHTRTLVEGRRRTTAAAVVGGGGGGAPRRSGSGVRRAQATAPEPDQLARGYAAVAAVAGCAGAAAAGAAAAEVWHHSYGIRPPENSDRVIAVTSGEQERAREQERESTYICVCASIFP